MNEQVQNRRGLYWGIVCWLLFCVAAVVIRGVRWDETFEHAQVMTRQIPYPAGHPLFRYVRSAFSAQTQLSAGMLWAGAGPLLICGLRNVLFLAVTVLPVFLFVSRIAGSVGWGCLGVVLAMEGIYLDFDGSYPLAVWPQVFSNGPVGGGCALLCLYAFASGRGALGFFLTGLMPCLHIGQMAALLPVAAWQGWVVWRRGWGAVGRCVVFGLLGLAVSGAVYGMQRPLAVDAPVTGGYAVQGDADGAWRDYTMYQDIHRQPPGANAHIVLIGLLLVAGLGAWREWRKGGGGDGRANGCVFVYALGIAAAVWGALGVQRVMGAETPFLIIGWMPYRMVNHAAPLLLAVAAGWLAQEEPDRKGTGRIVLLLLLVGAASRPLLEPVLGPALYMRYGFSGEGLFFMLAGAALAFFMPGAVLIAGLALAPFHQFGAVCMGAGWGMLWLTRAIKSPGLGLVLTASMAALAGLLVNELAFREQLPVSDFDREVKVYLDQPGERDAMLLAHPREFLLQARTGHPVFVETATASLTSYMPGLGPVIETMYRDVYGFDFKTLAATGWERVWQGRTRAEWVSLGEKYGFRYVIAPVSMRLDLPLRISRDGQGLYEASTEETSF